MPDPKTLEEIAEECAHSIYYDEDTQQVKAQADWLKYVASEICAALAEAYEQWRAEERKALRREAVQLRDDESDPDFDRVSNDRVAGWKAGLNQFIAAIDARSAADPSKPEASTLPLGHEFKRGALSLGRAFCYEPRQGDFCGQPESAHKPKPEGA